MHHKHTFDDHGLCFECDSPQPGSFLASLRKRRTGNCASCGAAFTGLTTKKFCSAKCRQRHKRGKAQ